MRVSLSMLMVLASLCASACGEGPPCVDEDDNELNFCEVNFAGVDEPVIKCPGEHWGAEDGCNSCACNNAGEIQCTSVECLPE